MIAEEVGLAPSNVLRYFGTREEIYFQVLGDAWNEWSQALERSLEGVPPSAAAIAAVVSRTLCERPLLCDLVAYIGPSFEYNVSVESVRRMTLIGRERVTTFSMLFTRLLSVTEARLSTFTLRSSPSRATSGCGPIRRRRLPPSTDRRVPTLRSVRCSNVWRSVHDGLPRSTLNSPAAGPASVIDEHG